MSCTEIDPRLMDILHKYFDNDLTKIVQWLNTENPALGDVSPTAMIAEGKQDRLVKWAMESAMIYPEHEVG